MKDAYDLWIGQVCESEVTRVGYLRNIGYFEVWALENYGLHVRGIPSKWREAKYESLASRERYLDELNDILKDYFAYLKRRYTPLSANLLMSVVSSYLHAFDIPVKNLRIKYAYVKYHNKDITKEEIRTILAHENVRNRAIDLMLYESGMRPITLTKLRWRHIKDEFLGHKIPMKIDLPSEILKCRVSERWTFIGQEGFEALKTYLVTRLPLKEDDLLFVKEKPRGGQLRTATISQAFNQTVKNLDLAEARGPEGKKPKEIRLYCLKKAFKKFHAAPEDYKKFWMGRTETSTHYVSKEVKYHRQLYAKGYENLKLQRPEVDEAVKGLREENRALRAKIEKLESRLNQIDVALGIRSFLGLPESERAELYAELKEAYEKAQKAKKK